jgi:hypothetical protein
VSRDAEAFVQRGVINVITSTPLFRAALAAERPAADRRTLRCWRV